MTKSVITREGERWDSLSQRTLGVPDQYPAIWSVNPDLAAAVRFAPTLPGGLTLQLPESRPRTRQVSETPPWR